jgi:hypothetical protein
MNSSVRSARVSRLFAFLAFLLVSTLHPPMSRAGDPIFRNSAGDGVGWNPSLPVRVWLYSGGLPQVTEAQLLASAKDAVAMWAASPGSRLNLQFMGTIPGPLDPNAFLSTFFADPSDPERGDPVRHDIVILPDPDGRILEQVGSGLSSQVYGLAWTIKRPTDSYIQFSVIPLNGRSLTPEIADYTIHHELGHALGLAHMEANTDCGQLIPPVNPSDCPDRPLMKRGSLGGYDVRLSSDDSATLASLYPADPGQLGRISGSLTLRSNDAAVPGAVIVAREVGNPRKNAVSSVTSSSLSRLGQFSIAGLSPGEYRLEAAPIVAPPSFSDALGDVESPFPALKAPATFLASTGGSEIPLNAFRLKVEGGKSYVVNLIQDDFRPVSPLPPRIRDVGAIFRDGILYAEVSADNPNGEPLAVWEKRLDASGAEINPGAWLWDETDSLGVTDPLLQMTFPAQTSRVSETRTIRLYLGGTKWYSDLDPSLPGVAAGDLLDAPVAVNPPVGDTDGDGALTIRDVVLALKQAVGLESLTLQQRMQADIAPLPGEGGRFYGNGHVDITDITALLRRLIGLDSGPLVAPDAVARSLNLRSPAENGSSDGLPGASILRRGGGIALP